MNLNKWIAEARPHAWAIRSGHPSLDAIEAVLDLHKPEQYDDSYSGATGYMCEACLCDDGVTYMEYPCPTVRAIETALKEYT